MKLLLSCGLSLLYLFPVTAQVTQLIDEKELQHMGNIPPADVTGETLILFAEQTIGTIWVTNGTTALTKPLEVEVKKELYSKCILMNGELYFVGETSVGAELWKTNGTAVGTKLVKDINPGVASSDPNNFFVLSNVLYFNAFSAAYGLELWKSDGTEAGTQLLKDLYPGPKGYGTGFFAVLHGELFFFRYQAIAMFQTLLELWKTDGTGAGTQLVDSIGILGKYDAPQFVTNYNNKLYFPGPANQDLSSPLYVADGTKAGTHKAEIDIAYPDPTSAQPIIVFNNKMFLSVPDSEGNTSLYVSDGTVNGTKLLDPVSPNYGNNGSGASVIDGRIIYETLDADFNFQLHATDGENVFVLNDFAPANISKSIWVLPPARFITYGQDTLYAFNTANFNGKVLAQTNMTANNPERHLLWLTDGTNEGSVFLSEMPDFTSDLFYGKSRIYFTNSDAEHGNEIFSTDGSPGNVSFFADINPGLPGSSPQFLFKENGKIFLFAYNHGQGLPGLFVIDDDSASSSQMVPKGYCAGSDTFFVAGVSGQDYTYQWQIDTGSGFQNLVNDQHYQGANADTLHMEAVPSTWYGYQYRCVISGQQQSSPEYVLRFKNQWLGNIDSKWDNPLNWSCGTVPDAFTDVYVTGGPLNINKNAVCRTLTIMPGVVVQVDEGATLDISH